MSESVAQIGFGMKLSHCDTVNGEYTDLVDLIEIAPQGWSVGAVEATHHQSPDTAEEAKPGLVSYKPLSATVSWSKTAHPAFNTLKRAEKFWKVSYPDGSFETFKGFIIDYTPATPLKDRMTSAIQIQPQTKSTFTASS